MNVPIILTLIRLIFSPLFLPLGLVYLLPYNNCCINFLCALCFVILSLTDFFDGYLARKYKQETMVGKALDPLADKFLFFSVLIALVTLQKLFFYWAIIFIGREFFVMGLRILALEQGFDVPVSWLGKLKTTAQMVYVTLAISGSFCGILIGNNYFVYGETFALIGALCLSLLSAYSYYNSFIHQLKMKGGIHY